MQQCSLFNTVKLVHLSDLFALRLGEEGGREVHESIYHQFTMSNLTCITIEKFCIFLSGTSVARDVRLHLFWTHPAGVYEIL